MFSCQIDIKVFMDFRSALRCIAAYLFLLEHRSFCLDIPYGIHGFTVDKSDLFAFSVALADIRLVDLPLFPKPIV